MKFTWKNVPDMKESVRKIRDAIPQQAAAALYHEAQIEVTEMKRRTPVDITPNAPHPGNLRNSIHAELPEFRGNRIVVIVATGAEAPYAIYVHENPDAFHPIGEWKFMESVINESAPHMAQRVAMRLEL